ncbi:DNAse I-like superfamily protein [Euphorbia peplus]|nr:DNAse I-like superfamily protein [Euphorbia peplus]
MKIISWNCFGAGGTSFQRALRHLVRVSSPDILVLLEPRLPGSRAGAIGRKLGFNNVEVVETVGFSGGVWMFWEDSSITISVCRKNLQFLHCQVTLHGGDWHGLSWMLTCVYVRPQMAFKRVFFDDLRLLSNSVVGPWLIVGDFNCIKVAEEKQGGSARIFDRCASFANWINSLNLVDLGFVGPNFTWYRGATPRTRVACRLDRALSNVAWRTTFPEAIVRHLPRNNSDHVPILVDFKGVIPSKPNSPFRFLAAWLGHGDFKSIVEDNWNSQLSLGDNLTNLAGVLDVWNEKVFGNIFSRKKHLYARLAGVQRSLGSRVTSGLLRLEQRLLRDLNDVLRQEELIWYQKSRVQWLLFGDRNTKFFHTSTIIRRRRNKVEGLKDDADCWVWDSAKLKEMAVRFYTALYTEDLPIRPPCESSHSFPLLGDSFAADLGRVFTSEEVKSAFFSMSPLKAPGPDGFHAMFYQRHWAIIGGSACSVVLKALNLGVLDAHLNDTLITLIPKVGCPESLSQFRPISLCNVAYKAISKCIVNRIKPFLPDIVSPMQSSFVPGRQITDNIILLQEVIGTMRKRYLRKNSMVLKLDLEKAYDRISWSFLRDTLIEVGMPNGLVNVIMECVTSSSLQVLWNGEKTEDFRPTRGLRQGDPLSPYLFVLCMERLSHLIIDAVSNRSWKAVRASQSGPALSHIFFADDIVLMSEASFQQAQVIKSILSFFCDCSGQKVSLAKSRVFFSVNTPERIKDEVCVELGISSTIDLGKYLGVPIIHDRISKNTYNYVVDRVKLRLAGWKAKCLSFAGRVTLVRSVLNAIPAYTMQTVMLPASICNSLDMVSRKFLWGATTEVRRISLVNWDTVCRSRNSGGLGIRKTKEFNTALVAKLGWRILTEPDSLWARVLKAKYAKGSSGVDVFKFAQGQSSIWKAVLAGSELLKKGIGRIVRSGNDARFWTDRWVDDVRLVDVAIHTVPESELGKNVAAYWTDSHSWNWEAISYFLPTTYLFRLASLVILHGVGVSDGWSWSCSNSGNFSVKSAFQLLSGEAAGDSVVSQVWKKVWTVRVSERVRCFLWLVVHNRILTNSNRKIRHLCESDQCPVCSNQESVLHVLRDCRVAAVVWRCFLPPASCPEFFSANRSSWVLGNLSSAARWRSIPWPVIFSVACWWIWRWRNEGIFDPNKSSRLNKVDFIVEQCMDFCKAYEANGTLRSGVRGQLVAWKCPEVGWVRLNCDGASKGNPGPGSAGGLIRSTEGCWISGFTCNLGICTAVLAELWGLYFGLDLAWKLGMRQVEVELDSQVVIQLVTEASRSFHRYFWLIEGCRTLLKRGWDVRVKHTFREGNQAADWLANFAGNLSLGYHECDGPPAGLQDILQADKCGIGTPRASRL